MDASDSLDDDVIEIIVPETWYADSGNKPEILAATDDSTEVCQRCHWDQRPSSLFPTRRDEMINGFDAQQVTRTEKCIRCRILKLWLESLGPDYQSPDIIIIQGTGFSISKRPYDDYEDFDIFVADASNGPPSWLPRGNTSWSSHSSSTESFEWTRREIDKCIDSHACCRSLGNSFMPTRLINICPRNIAGDVFLQDGSSVPRGSRYCALSYCWGDIRPDCLTTKATLAQRQSNIPWSTLPQTFQDAIYWARSAGVDYLWIDSVCILQGDRDDWIRESGKMFQVYQNSYVTIVAAFGKDPTSGLFSAYPDEPKPKPLATLRRASAGSSWPLYMRKAQHYHFYDWEDYETREALPLLKRAWCYQERLISPRILLYTPTEVAFQCFKTVSCECGRDGVACNRMNFAAKHKFPVPGKQPLTHAGPAMDWWIVIGTYANMDLTVKSDRLPAVAGIAEHFQKSRPLEKYLAGLWSGNLLRDLLWEVLEVTADPAAKTLTAGVPSWSWASGSGTRDVLVYTEQLRYLAEVREAECRYASDNQFGVLTGSKLVLRGRLWKVSALCRKGGPLWMLSRRAVFKFESSNEMRGSLHLDSGIAKRNWSVVRGLHLLEIAQRPKSDGDALDTLYLILKSARTSGNSYVRVGVFEQEHNALGKLDRDKWDNLGLWGIYEIN
ncbi:heterokaryon incompatibility protein-domain-containing protein [Annulohypoxylon truncatum]|uniref:heterokaryon incompatibility protein-domain-containing protein n=1 Tax=Annulohypoxylon truncatum TaxID=327061 RepID=UPI0020085865|nr:heterokaryon incompatibility protein-domain-containing protein [Annulohypoxylon truncatum]KAI1212057.1 heterokaryon incompatibility protein-domain-containing protein [Annulohypoxylon truncatum]